MAVLAAPVKKPVFAALTLALACGEPPPPPPTAVVKSTPASVCRGDDFRTLVTLDASDSQPALALVPVPNDGAALSFAWAFAGGEVHEEGRDAGDVVVRLRTRGDRPVHVTLAVTNDGGGEATTLHTLPITVPEPLFCGESACPDGMRCLDVDGARVCSPDEPCTSDADCPACMACNTELGACLLEAAP